MVRKYALSFLVIMALFLAACSGAGTGEDASGVGMNDNDVAVTGIPSSDANANDTLVGNSNDALGANSNDALGNTNANSNDALSNTNANNNDALGNTNANNNDALGNTNGNDNANGNANAAEGALTTTTPAAPAGTGLANPDSYDLFVQSLTAQGVSASPDADWTTYTFAGFPAGRGRALSIGGDTVYVIEFQDAMTAQAVYQAWQSGALPLQDYFQGGATSPNTNANSNDNTNANSNDNTNANTNSNANSNGGANSNGDANMNANSNAATGSMVSSENVWSYGRIVVVYFGDNPETIQMLGRMMTAQTDGTSDGSGATGADAAALPTGVMSAIEQYAADQFQAAPGSVQILSVLPVEYQDACLGAAGDSAGNDANNNDANSNDANSNDAAVQNCAQVITPGYAVTVLVNGQQYVLRVSQDGSVVRQAPEGLTQ